MRDHSKNKAQTVAPAPRALHGVQSVTVNMDDLTPNTVADIDRQLREFRAVRAAHLRELRSIEGYGRVPPGVEYVPIPKAAEDA